MKNNKDDTNAERDRDQADTIIGAFSECQNATTEMLYMPVELVGQIIQAALSMRRDMERSQEFIRDLQLALEQERAKE